MIVAEIPVANSTFTEELVRRLHRPAVFAIPGALLGRLGGDFANELLLGGQRALPNKALGNAFVFRQETLRSCSMLFFRTDQRPSAHPLFIHPALLMRPAQLEVTA
jgi:NAD dependent epimerase/dehydratase family enzyme